MLLIGTTAAMVGLVTLAAHVYTDFLWFREVGQEQAFWTSLKWKIAVRIVIVCGTASFVLLNLLLVERTVAALRGQGAELAATPVWAYRRLLIPLAAVIAGVASNKWVAGGIWQPVLMWLHRGDFGVTDPLFHRDVGFFVFSLPLYQQIAHWLYLTIVTAGVATVAGYVAAGAIRITLPPAVAPAARTHLLSLGALLLVLIAWRYRLDQFALALSHEHAVVPGAGYTDVHVQLPMLRALVILSVAGAVLCLYAAWWRARLPVMVAAGVLVALLTVTMAGRGALSAAVQRFDVEPQELSRERPYVSDAIASTQRAFQLDRVSARALPGDARLLPQEIAANADTLDNIPLWDASVLRPAMGELQSIGTYYGFPSTTLDRYTIGGRPRVLTLAARQLDLEGVKPDARSWANERFAYTHGYGVVATEAQEVDEEQQPGFAEHDVRARRNPLRLREPRIYFGERPDYDPPYSVLRTGRGEVEEPAPGVPQRDEYHYSGAGGIQLTDPLKRIAFAARFADPKLLLTQTVDKSSRLVLHRDARERLVTIAPFVHWDAHPQTVVVDGRVKFLFHGYTTSNHYPYAASVRLGQGRFNYIRAAVQGVVDGFTGRPDMYATDSADPILRAWRAAYPGVFRNASEMPAELRAHLRYPEHLFAAQAQAYATYHVGTATRFWTAEDAWQRSAQLAGPVENAGEIDFPNGNDSPPMAPSYQLSRLPGDSEERFRLVTPFTPRGRQNLAGYLAGSVDSLGRPQLTLLRLPDDRLTIGPTQATRRILANSGVSQRLDLVNRESRDLGKNAVSRTVLGVPRLVPVGNALLYVQPFYLLAGESGIPRLQLVTVHVNGRVGYGRTLAAALRMAVVPINPK